MEAAEQEIQKAQDKLLHKRAMLAQTEKPGPNLEPIDWDAIAAKHIQESLNNPNVYLCAPEAITIPEGKKLVSMPPKLPLRYSQYRFDNFTGNDGLANELKTLASEPCDIFLTGNTGSGKTHLACAMLNEIRTLDGARFISVPALLVKARSVFRENSPISEDDLINLYTKCELLCLDDLGAEKTTAYSIQVLYLIIDQRIAECRRTIITSNLSLPEIDKQIDSRIASRIAGMENIKIEMPDYRKRRTQ